MGMPEQALSTLMALLTQHDDYMIIDDGCIADKHTTDLLLVLVCKHH